jgi:hypothetical protein
MWGNFGFASPKGKQEQKSVTYLNTDECALIGKASVKVLALGAKNQCLQ